MRKEEEERLEMPKEVGGVREKGPREEVGEHSQSRPWEDTLPAVGG